MSSVRVKADLFVKDETLLEEEAAAEEDDLKEIILRERLHEKRDIETSLKILLTISLYFETKYKNTHEIVCILSGIVLDLWCGILLELSKHFFHNTSLYSLRRYLKWS